ncbi:MAG: cyclic beta 1-2 glucan synthetase, partial [Mariniphaga sp.]|nr:cyclic beta 1-2 glucan synthetase [Mariniphaga sp.]
MKVSRNTLLDILARLRVYFHGGNGIRYDNEEPFRSELYSTDQMNRHGEVVARSHKLLKVKSPDQLLKRLDENEEILLEVRKLLVENIHSEKTITPAAEWLLDNFYLIEEQITIARKHLPKGYSEGLPCLDGGISAGFPRVYDIVLEIISHSDGRVDAKSLRSFISAYQKNTTLTLGELWAIPIMLRLAVIENLRRVSRKIALHMIDNNLADVWADAMTKTVNDEPGNLILTIADLARSKPVLSGPFVAAFIRKLQGTGPSLALPLSWIEQQLSGMGTTSIDHVREENQKQAADQVSVRNCIGTLRFLGATDWREFVETLSLVEQVLRQDITGTYPLMDFATRDRYRHVVEAISKASPLSETEVAQKVIELALKHKELNSESKREDQLGYYLIDKGLRQTEIACGMLSTLKQKLSRFTRRKPVFLYLLSIAFITLLSASGMFYVAWGNGINSWLLLTFVGLLSVSGSAHLAVSMVNWLSTIWVKPKLLPRMDFSKGIPAECRTLVVVPTMLSGMAYIEQLVEALEIRYLANKDDNLHFGLLTDFLDADTAIIPGDDDLLELVSTRIDELNQKYKQTEQDIFFLFHRPRKWNTRQRKWMGYERKRGKLSALNAFIQGRSRDEFSLVVGSFTASTRVKYVITLDSDTQLPRESAWKFIATMAHPLNHAIYNQRKRRVTDGYGILQPRVDSAIPKGAPSLYLRMQGNVSGIDPYTRVSSDVYQDLFAEGSFIGKGIYEVDIFEKAVHEVFRENRILSHDLIEGCYTRSGLISDVLLYEESPAQYEAEVKRRYRWIRGDWQISSWILPFVEGFKGRLIRNKLSAISRWKIYDNLRRSLLPLTLLLILLFGWSILPFPLFWTLAVGIFILLPVMAAAGWRLINKPGDLTFMAHLSEVGISVRDIIFRFIFDIAVLPYEAYKYTDAVLCTIWRMTVLHKKLLEWTPSATASLHSRNEVLSVFKVMWIAPFLAITFLIFLSYSNPVAMLAAGPILILWLIAPALAWLLSKPEKEPDANLSEEQLMFLHKSARKTWLFFEQFVTSRDNWLPPDNFQEQPVPTIAHRTSPSNIGLALLANLSAYDFGYIGGDELIVRCNNTLQTMLKLERYRGHFYNWYDTVSLLPLQPRYVSTVDSGNLIGHLLTLRQGFIALPALPVFSGKQYDGLRTTALILRDFSNGKYTDIIDKIIALLNTASIDLSSLSIVKKNLDELILLVNELIAKQVNSQTNLFKWADRLLLQIQNMREDLVQQVPWLELLPFPEHYADLAVTDQIPSLLVIQNMPELILQHNDLIEQQVNTPEEEKWLKKLNAFFSEGSKLATVKIRLLDKMAEQCEDFCDVDYSFLYNKTTSLLRIGYNVDDQRKDDSYYDLLASEARFGIFVAIAQGKLPQESWFALGRLLTKSAGEPILLS